MYKGAVHASGVGVGQGGGSLLSRVSMCSPHLIKA